MFKSLNSILLLAWKPHTINNTTCEEQNVWKSTWKITSTKSRTHNQVKKNGKRKRRKVMNG